MLARVVSFMLLAGCAMTPEQAARQQAGEAREAARLDQRLAGYVPGTPVSCIDPRNTNVDIFGDTLVYREGAGRRLYVNRTSGGCFGLRRDDIIVTRSVGTSQLCRGDIVNTVDRTSRFPSGSCSFGEFVPYTRPRS